MLPSVARTLQTCWASPAHPPLAILPSKVAPLAALAFQRSSRAPSGEGLAPARPSATTTSSPVFWPFQSMAIRRFGLSAVRYQMAGCSLDATSGGTSTTNFSS